MGYQKDIEAITPGEWVYLEEAGIVHVTKVDDHGESVDITWDAYDSPVTRHIHAASCGVWSGRKDDFPTIYVSEA